MKISIVVAIFNRKDELFELLNSLSHQTCKDFEVIIVDDGSKIELQPTVDMFKEMLTIRYFKKKIQAPDFPVIMVHIVQKASGWCS